MMTQPDSPIPDLPPRLLQPEGWRWHVFTNPQGKKLRFGTVSPKSKIPDAVVVLLPGLSEFAEKYFELAHDLLDHNLAVWVMDWQGQGKSERMLANPHKRHAVSFDNDIADLDYFINEYVRHAAVHPDVGRIPMVMLAHSMGANIGLRYLIKNPGAFTCAAFSAPLTMISAIGKLPLSLALDLARMLREAFNLCYVFGAGNWSPHDRDTPVRNIFSHDPERNAVHNAWCKADPALQVGGVTYGWVYAALQSCYALRNDLRGKSIDIPCLFALAGEEALVSNSQTRKLIAALPQAEILELQESRHEILMERDDIRNRFLDAFYAMLAKYHIRDKLQRF